MKIEIHPPHGTKFVCEIPEGYAGSDILLYEKIGSIHPDIILANPEMPAIKFNMVTKKWEDML